MGNHGSAQLFFSQSGLPCGTIKSTYGEKKNGWHVFFSTALDKNIVAVQCFMPDLPLHVITEHLSFGKKSFWCMLKGSEKEIQKGKTYEEIPNSDNDCHSGFDGFL